MKPMIYVNIGTAVAGIIYSALTAGFSNTTCSLENLELRECPTLESNIYRTWYVVGVAEIVGK
jgi:hypothetical protein